MELDPLVATGVLLEVHRHEDRYVLLERAPATGNRILRFSSKDGELVYAATRTGSWAGPLVDAERR